MRVLRLVYEWPPPWDGLASGIYELTRAQVERGHEVMVFCGGGFKNLGRDKTHENGIKGGRVLRVYRFPRVLKRLSLFLTTSPAIFLGYLFLRLTGRGPDLVHGHGHITCCFNIYKLFLGWLDKTPYVLHLHITAAGRAVRARSFKLDFWTKNFEWSLHKFSDWLGVRVADRVICVSSRVRDEAIEFYGANPKRIVVVENGVNTALFTPKPHSVSRVTHNVLYVGALNPRKNVNLLIEAMSFLPDDYRLTIVGRGPKEYEEKLHRSVEDLKLQNRVDFKGYVEYPNLPSYYRLADVFILPSSYEGLPKVVLEALASGVPVLASGFEIKEKIRGLKFLDNLDSAAIAERIRRVIDSGVEVDVLRVQEFYSWEKKAKEIEAVYSSVIDSIGRNTDV